MARTVATQASASARPRRTPVGTRNILTVSGKKDGYHYRIVNDQGDRIQEFIDNGWELVPANEVRVGDKRINQAKPEGSNAQVSVGGGDKAFVMRIKQEWYDEDQAAKLAHNKEIMRSVQQSASSNADYGKVEITRD